MAANGISTLQYKADRQQAKLNLAKTKRSTTGRNDILDTTELPTLYTPGDNTSLINNPNTSGLQDGRPWK